MSECFAISFLEDTPSSLPQKPTIPSQEISEPEVIKQPEPSIETPAPTQETLEPEVLKQPESSTEPLSDKTPTEVVIPITETSSGDSLSVQFDNLLEHIETMTGEAIGSTLETLQDIVLEEKGFSAVLRQIRMTSAALKSNKNLLGLSEKEELNYKIKFWRSKLKL